MIMMPEHTVIALAGFCRFARCDLFLPAFSVLCALTQLCFGECDHATISEITPNVNFQYNAGNGGVGPPGSFNMIPAGTGASAGSIAWHSEFIAFHSQFNISINPLTPTVEPVRSVCPAGCRIAGWCTAMVQPHLVANPYPFGKTSSGPLPNGWPANTSHGWLGFQAFGDGNDCGQVVLQTNQRTFRVAKVQVGWAMWRSPFIVSDDRKIILGYKWDNSINDSFDYRIFDMNPDEWGVSFSPSVTPNGAGFAGDCGSAISGIWGGIGENSGVRVATSTGIIELTAQAPQIAAPSQVRFRKSNANRSFDLVLPAHPRASPVRVNTSNGIRAIRQFTP